MYNEMIISIYDCMYCFSVKLNGNDAPNEYSICHEFDLINFGDQKQEKIIWFMEKYNIHRLIVCEDGSIDIYKR